MIIENLHKGRWVAAVNRYDGAATNFDGTPFKVVSVSTPFVLMQGLDGRRVTVDLRRWNLTYLNDDFVRAKRKTAGKVFVPPMGSEEASDGVCQYCGTRVVERLAGSAWLAFCKGCNRWQK